MSESFLEANTHSETEKTLFEKNPLLSAVNSSMWVELIDKGSCLFDHCTLYTHNLEMKVRHVA